MPDHSRFESLVHDSPAARSFHVSRQVFVDEDTLAVEREQIFERCWLYLGHESELRKKGDFVSRRVAGRELIFTRDARGELNALMNSCPHRGAMVCRERQGNTKSFQCFYHGWIFGMDGACRDIPGADSYPEGFKESPEAQLRHAPRFEIYRGFAFVCFDKDAISLSDYLGNAKDYIDMVADHSQAGMEIIGGTQEYSIKANWKLLCENSADGYHAATNHATYLDYLKDRGDNLVPIALSGIARDLGNGHAVVEYRAPWGRPVAQWIPAWGEDGKRELDEIYARLVARFGEERADRIAHTNRNLLIFPNLVINDIMAITVRTFFPTAPDMMSINAWSLVPADEAGDRRRDRLFNFLEFLGPGGFATPDDIEALEQCQRGYANNKELGWNIISRGMGKEVPSYDDELQMRAYWTEWRRRMTQGEPA
jgi:p-cumate 2,3-dioxygenase alpha subunit